jgi:hypothetical protein
MHYIIGGTGNCPANVIETALSDIKENAKFHYMWTGKPTAGQARVLDWLIDHSAMFKIYAEVDKVPAVVQQAAHSVKIVDDLIQGTLDENLKAEVLVLFDTDHEGNPTASTERLIFLAHDRKMVIRELTNGLVPIEVEDEGTNTPSEAPRKPQDEPKVEVAPPTRMEKVLTVAEPVMQITVYSDGSIKTKQL